MMRFVTRLSGVQCLTKDSKHIIHFDEKAPRATVSAESSFSGGGQHSFEVLMKHKPVKTAVGFLSRGQTTEYMRDDPLPEPHVSFGGAGWIHPKEIAADGKYAQGDTVKAEVDFTAQKVNFYVNGSYVGQDEWSEQQAFPAVSCDGGPCELEITF